MRLTQFYFCLILFIFPCILIADEKLVFALDVVRHGDRTPIHVFKGLPYPWKEAPGELTVKGMKAHYELGKYFRERYVDQAKLLSPQFNNNEIFVRSTDFDRTLMSAQALLVGFYPIGQGPLPGGFQPIPIHSCEKKDDVLLTNDNYKNEFNRLLKTQVYTSPAWVNKTKETQGKWAAWSKVTGKEITHLSDFVALGDTLKIYRIYDIKIPNLSDEDRDEMIQLGRWAFAARYQAKEIGELLGRKQMEFIQGFIVNFLNHENENKYILISAHDNTLLSMMSILGAPLAESPNYGDNLNFSIFENDQHKRFIRIRYNEREIAVPSFVSDWFKGGL